MLCYVNLLRIMRNYIERNSKLHKSLILEMVVDFHNRLHNYVVTKPISLLNQRKRIGKLKAVEC